MILLLLKNRQDVALRGRRKWARDRTCPGEQLKRKKMNGLMRGVLYKKVQPWIKFLTFASLLGLVSMVGLMCKGIARGLLGVGETARRREGGRGEPSRRQIDESGHDSPDI